jgi:hypothetical protein
LGSWVLIFRGILSKTEENEARHEQAYEPSTSDLAALGRMGTVKVSTADSETKCWIERSFTPSGMLR